MSSQRPAFLRRATATIIGADALLILFPPLHWAMGNGSAALALGYAIGVPVLIGVSLVVLDRITAVHGNPATEAEVLR